MESMMSPGYVYRPHSEERRRKQQIAARARFGLPPDCRKLYGVILREELAERLRPIICQIANKKGAARATEAILAFQTGGPWALRPFMKEAPSRVVYYIRARREMAALRKAKKKRKAAAKRYRLEQRVAAKLKRKMDAKLLRLEAAEERAQHREMVAQENRIAAERFRRTRAEMSPTERAAAERREQRRALWRRMSSEEKAEWWRQTHEAARARRLVRELDAKVRAERRERRAKYRQEMEATRLVRMRHNAARAMRRAEEYRLKAEREKERMERAKLRAARKLELARRLVATSERRRLEQEAAMIRLQRRQAKVAKQKAESARETQKTFALALHAEGMDRSEIAAMVQVSPATIKNWVEEARTKRR